MFTVIYFVLTEASFPWYSAGGRTEGTSSREACVIKFVGSRLPQVVHCAFTTILAQHSVATLLWHCFEQLQHCSNIATLCCTKNRRCESSRVTSPLRTIDPKLNKKDQKSVLISFIYYSQACNDSICGLFTEWAHPIWSKETLKAMAFMSAIPYTAFCVIQSRK